jgi:hypothetical protein
VDFIAEIKSFRKELKESRLIAEQAKQESKESRLIAERAEANAYQAKQETKADRKDSRLLALSVARSLMGNIINVQCGFETNHNAGSPDTYCLTFEGKASWQGKFVVGAQKKITELAEGYRTTVQSTNSLRSVVCRWDKIKETRNLEQHGYDVSAKLSEMIGFYHGHITLGDLLQAEDLELYHFFMAVEKLKSHDSTVPVVIAAHVPIGGGATKRPLSYAQVAKSIGGK